MTIKIKLLGLMSFLTLVTSFAHDLSAAPIVNQKQQVSVMPDDAEIDTMQYDIQSGMIVVGWHWLNPFTWGSEHTQPMYLCGNIDGDTIQPGGISGCLGCKHSCKSCVQHFNGDPTTWCSQ
ncbi:MAG: hypothetical protein J0L93_03415 [Deltaproteobacteria bacterium]|nr:hypothetical protein [Deltaproteobacteria bacterium]